MNREDLCRLVDAYADGSITLGDAEELAAAIRSDSGQSSEVLRELAAAGMISRAVRNGDDDESFVREFSRRRSLTTASVGSKKSGTPPFASRTSEPAARRWPILDWVAIAATAAVVLLIIQAWKPVTRHTNPSLLTPSADDKVSDQNTAPKPDVTDDPAIEKELRAILLQFDDDDFEKRMAAGKLIEAFVRQKGERAFIALERIRRDTTLNADTAGKIESILQRLSAPSEIAWSATLAQGEPGMPVPAGKVLIQALVGVRDGTTTVEQNEHGRTGAFGHGHSVFAVDRETGKKLWDQPGSWHVSDVVVHNDTVYTIEDPGGLAAYAAADGRKLWYHDLTKAPNWKGTIFQSHIAFDPIRELFCVGWWDCVMAVDKSGRRAWTYDIEKSVETNTIWTGSPVFSNGKLFVVTQERTSGEQSRTVETKLLCLKANDGKPVWWATSPGVLDLQAPLVLGGEVLVLQWNDGDEHNAKSNSLCRFDVLSGKMLSSVTFEPPIRPQGMMDEQHTLLATNDERTELLAIDIETGKVKWKHAGLNRNCKISTSDNEIFAGTTYDDLICLDGRTGALIWQLDLMTLDAAAKAPKEGLTYIENGVPRVVDSLGSAGPCLNLDDRLYVTMGSGWMVAFKKPQFTRGK